MEKSGRRERVALKIKGGGKVEKGELTWEGNKNLK